MKYCKYKAVKVKEDGITFDSKAEHRRYLELKLLEKAKKIEKLSVHFKLPFAHGDDVVFTYIADFYYIAKGVLTIEDVKGVETPVFRLKWKLIRKAYPQLDMFIIKNGIAKKTLQSSTKSK